MKKMFIQCSNCGKRHEFVYSTQTVLKAVKDGWNSFGNALYCPECSATWNERNKGKKMNGYWNTIRVIDEWHDNQTSRKRTY